MTYPARVWDHFRAPRHAGRLERACCRGDATTPASGAQLELALRVHAGRVADAAFLAHGCPCTIAAGSWLAEWLIGRGLAEARALDSATIAEQLELPAVKRYCAVLAQDALRTALAAIDEGDQSA